MRSWAGVLLLVTAASTASGAEPATQKLTERARQIAELLEVQPLIERVVTAPPPTNLQEEVAHNERRADALAEVQRVSLMIDGTLARLQLEQFAAAQARDFLNNRGQSAVTDWNLAAVLTGSGTTAVGTSLQFGNETEARVGDGLIVAGAVAAAAFTIVALVRKSHGHPQYSLDTSFLAPLFGRAPLPGSELPAPIWRYLDTPLAGEAGSYRSQLIDRFVKEGSISLAATPSAERRIDLLTRPISRSEVVAPGVLDVRAKMLDDLRARVAGMKIDLVLLMHEVARQERK